jgi:hypothetical protein
MPNIAAIIKSGLPKMPGDGGGAPLLGTGPGALVVVASGCIDDQDSVSKKGRMTSQGGGNASQK